MSCTSIKKLNKNLLSVVHCSLREKCIHKPRKKQNNGEPRAKKTENHKRKTSPSTLRMSANLLLEKHRIGFKVSHVLFFFKAVSTDTLQLH